MKARNTLVVDVAQALREMMLSGEVPPGGFLPSQKSLAARFNVGLSTVHEAVQVLSTAGLVQSHPGKGTWVRPDAFDGLIHPVEARSRFGNLDPNVVTEARQVVETALTELAAQRAGPEDVERIRAALDRMRATLDDEEAYVAADVEFHIGVARAGGNELLAQVYYLARGLLEETILEMVHSLDTRITSIELQGRVLDAIARRDVAAAGRASQAHMEFVKSLVQH